MKKNSILSLFQVCVFLITMLLSNVPEVNAEELHEESENVYISDTGNYEYTYTQDKICWDELGTYEEMVNKTQIPIHTLEKMSTAEIIKMILKYPLLNSMNSFDNLYAGYENLKKTFYAVEYVISREDCLEVLYEQYENYEIPRTRKIDYTPIIKNTGNDMVTAINEFASNKSNAKLIVEDALVVSSVQVMEFMLLDLIGNDESQFEKFSLIYNEVLNKKNESEYFSENNTNSVVCAMNLVSPLISFNVTIKTPGGTNVICTFNNTTESSTSNVSYDIATFHCTLVSNGTIAYNCHSYAWLKSLYPSEYTKLWLNSVSAFISDSSYGKESKPTASGRIANWSKHSAIVTNISKNNPYNHYIPEPYVTSKWGPGAIYSHYLSLCPYEANLANISYYYLK